VKKYLIVIEKTRTGYSAFCPDLPGCVAAARTKAGVERKMRNTIDFHLEGMKEEGLKVPAPQSYSTYLNVKAA
jgi:predicted RNase H-like HicB family nuclease